MAKAKKRVQEIVTENERELKCMRRQNRTWIYVRPGVEVLDNRGKRRIGKDNHIQVELHDKVMYDEEEYVVSNIAESTVTLTKV